uniref:Uncharacterized protein n=1 Tax=Pipistrellus kuhlii TaxID=59472 RepID=A0A7J7U9T7_PIPKU|nr:hypothetical protein mPipKuh1_009147 [Pipistrellus kuhlii]
MLFQRDGRGKVGGARDTGLSLPPLRQQIHLDLGPPSLSGFPGVCYFPPALSHLCRRVRAFGTSTQCPSALELFLQLKTKKTPVVKGKPQAQLCWLQQPTKYMQTENTSSLLWPFGGRLPFLIREGEQESSQCGHAPREPAASEAPGRPGPQPALTFAVPLRRACRKHSLSSALLHFGSNLSFVNFIYFFIFLLFKVLQIVVHMSLSHPPLSPILPYPAGTCPHPPPSVLCPLAMLINLSRKALKQACSHGSLYHYF